METNENQTFSIPKQSFALHFGGAETQVVFFCARRFLHTSNGFSMILTHVKCDFRCHGAKSLFLHRFYKQNEIACILWFGVLRGLEGALRQGCFVSCFKTSARIKILRGNITFCALVPAGSNPTFCTSATSKVPRTRFSRSAKSQAKQMEIHQTEHFRTSYNMKIFKIRSGL